MNKQEAEQLAAKITADPHADAAITGLRTYGRGRWEIDLQDYVSGYMFTIGSAQDWQDRQEAKEFAAQHGA